MDVFYFNGQCVNTDRSFRCICNPGYRLSPDGAFCLGVRVHTGSLEVQKMDGFYLNGQCINIDGSFRCICNQGYRLSPDGAFCLGRFCQK